MRPTPDVLRWKRARNPRFFVGKHREDCQRPKNCGSVSACTMLLILPRGVEATMVGRRKPFASTITAPTIVPLA
jgi:hypothetical protein